MSATPAGLAAALMGGCDTGNSTTAPTTAAKHSTATDTPTNSDSLPLSGKQRRKATMGYEEVALCAICQDGEWEDDDQIIFCDQCNMPVHQSCYGSGANRIPDGPWYCDPCSVGRRTGNKQQQECILCPIKGGALKRTSDFRWAHIVCGLWIPEAEFLDPEGRDIINPFTINEKRLDLTCSLCNKPGGACIQCKAPRCLTAFHASCARNHGVYMAEKEKIKDGEEYVEKLVLCDKHKPTDGSKKKRRKREIKW